MNKIRLLEREKIAIPKGAMSFYTSGMAIIFFVRDISDDPKIPFQGNWRSEERKLTAEQYETLKKYNLTGDFGYELEVQSRLGYMPQ